MSDVQQFWIYMIECDNGSYYTGYTGNVARRYRLHLDGKANVKYTRSFRPVRLAQCWRIECTVGTALRIEKLIKRSGRSTKTSLVEDGTRLGELVAKRIDDPVTVSPFSASHAEAAALDLSVDDLRTGVDPLEGITVP